MSKGSVTTSIKHIEDTSFYHSRKCDGASISGSTLVLGVCVEFSME
jgi:hypothetical protein